jgi:hypothetical protein
MNYSSRSSDQINDNVSAEIAQLSSRMDELFEKLQTEIERADRISQSIKECEQKARKLGLYEAKKID